MSDKNKVLVVDDDPALLKMTAEILHDKYVVSCVKSGTDAIGLLSKDYMPDIILMDVDMPGLNGFETVTALREIENARNIPVVFLTGLTGTATELEGLSCGAVDYIAKPFVSEILLARMKVHVENGKRIKMRTLGKPENDKWIDCGKFSMLASELNETERKTLHLIALGYTNQEIGEELNYSYNYIKKVVGVIYDKMCVTKRSDLKKMLL